MDEDRLSQLIAADEDKGIGSVSDAEFFARNPTRNYRMRLATANEIAAAALITGQAEQADDPQFVFMAVKQIAPGVRARVGCKGLPPPGVPLSNIPEKIASKVFQRLCRSGGR